MLVQIPPEIGKLKRLRKLILNGNKIKSLPSEVGRLIMLEELVVSENSLQEIPGTIATMAALRVLKVKILRFSFTNFISIFPCLYRCCTSSICFHINRYHELQLQNNDLLTIPYELVDVVTLEELDFSGNTNLKMVPKLWQGDTESVLFVCRIHRGE
jgi:Leucine-rich repeat (LRR) protein